MAGKVLNSFVIYFYFFNVQIYYISYIKEPLIHAIEKDPNAVPVPTVDMVDSSTW